jgi:predicted S18 family serine protease
MKKLIIVLLFLLLIPFVSARTGHMKLLAVQDVEKDIGNTADLYLEVKQGTGRIFLDTFPLTQIDTQMSTRLAKEIACEFLEKDCSRYDFFYTIRSGSSIVGGPSAGAALSALTVIMLEDLEYDKSVVVTGSINSGGIIGPVGGIKTKIKVAEENNISKVLIPATSLDNKTNITNTSIDVMEVATLREVIKEFTGKTYGKETYELKINQEYNTIMKNIATIMCNRTQILKKQVKDYSPNSEVFNKIKNRTKSAEKSFNNSNYYPAASYCFGTNIDLSHELTKNLSDKKTLSEINDVKTGIERFEEMVDKKEINTIPALQTKIIVKERLLDAMESLKEGHQNLEKNSSRYNLAYARERFHSAIIWSHFFNMSGKDIDLKQEQVRASCTNKIAEAEERINYLMTITLLPFNSTREEITQAKFYREEEEYEMCLFKANKAKSNIDVTLSLIGIKEDSEVKGLIDAKLKYAEEQIAREIEKDSFPILGYSYYIYAKDLKEEDPLSSLIYSELALELSNMWPYFQTFETKEDIKLIDFNQDFLNGFLAGLIATIILVIILNKKKPHK